MHVAIIGNGITGITCARHLRKESDCRITVISSESEFFFSRTALMYIYMGHMRHEDTKPYEDWFWKKNRIELVYDHVTAVRPEEKQIELKGGEPVSYDRLVIASGSLPNKFGWPGQDLPGVQGLYHLQDLQTMEEYSVGLKRAVIVGGGLIGIEMAEMFRSRGIAVTFLVREESFWNRVLPKEESAMINRHIGEHGVELKLDTELKSIHAGEDGRVAYVLTGNDEKIECGFVGLTAGVHPNVGFLQGSGIQTNKGVLVNRYLETNIEGIYAAGDCAEFSEALPGRRPVEQVWYTGKMQGRTLARTLCGKRTAYEPGHWFNSAKFFDIEYQTYGEVPAELKENQDSFYWEHPDGRKAIRIVYQKATGTFIGLHSFGIRYRHHLINQFLDESAGVRQVISHLKAGHFDPESYTTYEHHLVTAYNERFAQDPIRKTSRKGWNAFQQLFKATAS